MRDTGTPFITSYFLRHFFMQNSFFDFDVESSFMKGEQKMIFVRLGDAQQAGIMDKKWRFSDFLREGGGHVGN